MSVPAGLSNSFPRMSSSRRQGSTSSGFSTRHALVLGIILIFLVMNQLKISFDDSFNLAESDQGRKNKKIALIAGENIAAPEPRSFEIVNATNTASNIKYFQTEKAQLKSHEQFVEENTVADVFGGTFPTEESIKSTMDQQTKNRHDHQHPVLRFRQQHQSTYHENTMKVLTDSSGENSIPVVLWPLMDSGMNAKKGKINKGRSPDVIHIEENGVKESSVLRLANESIRTMDANVVWVTDAKFPYKIWCTRLHKKVLIMQERRRQFPNYTLPSVWPVFVVDFTDTPQYQSCPPLEKALGKDHVFYSKRSTVINRTWNFQSDWIDMGIKLNETTTEGRFYFPTSLIVRTDIVEMVAKTLAALRQESGETKFEDHVYDSYLAELEEIVQRPVDVAHYWPPSTERAKFSNMRNRISSVLMHHFSKDYNVFCDMVGSADRVGRRHAQSAYVRAMLETKIIVVGQRDTYEDHYRLYEALISGAMVITDPMLTLPAELKNGTNLIVFSSLSDLVYQVRYYLSHEKKRIAIAKAGRFVAMSRHRSWHRMEEIILGKVVTTCERSNASSSNSACPFTVHSVG